MFEELGLNVARQPDNAANPRPDNRSGWLEGETPDVVEELLQRRRAGARRSSWTSGCGTPRRSCASAPSARVPPRPDGAPEHGRRSASEARGDERDRRAPGGARAARPARAACA